MSSSPSSESEMFTNDGEDDAGIAEEDKGVAADGAVGKDRGVNGKDGGVAADGAVGKDGGVSGKDGGVGTAF